MSTENTERDTHFQGAAEKLFQKLYKHDLLDLNGPIPENPDEFPRTHLAKNLIAQFLYDFAVYFRENINEAHLEWMDTPELIAEMPDMAELPE